MWNGLKSIFNAAFNPVDTTIQGFRETQEYYESTKLYITEEYDKALREVSPPLEGIKAAGKIAPGIAGLLVNSIQEFLQREYHEFGCLNFQARMNTVCQVAGNILAPPISALQILKYGSRAIRASPRLSAIINNQKRIFQARRLNRVRRLAENSLKRNLTQEEVAAIESAHNFGRGEIGLDGTPARIGNYTEAQLRQKAEILERAGFSRAERRELVQGGVVGLSSNGFSRLFGQRPSYLKRDGRARYDQFKDALADGNISGNTQYIAFPHNGQHIAGKITSFNRERIQVETINGAKFTVSGESLREVRISGTSKTYFARRLENAEQPAYQRFRDDWNVLNISEDNRYVSFIHPDGHRRPGIITSIYDDDRRITVLDEAGKEIEIRGGALNHIRVSSGAKEALENRGARAPPINILSSSQDYNFFK